MIGLSSDELSRVSKILKFKYSCIATGALFVLIPVYVGFLYFEKNYDYSFKFSKKIIPKVVSKSMNENEEISALSNQEIDRLLFLLEERKNKT